MAKNHPKSKFFGYDSHEKSIENSNKIAKNEGIENKVNFKIFSANATISEDYNVIALFDCLHYIGVPVRYMKQIKKSLKQDGTCMIVEPMAHDKIKENLNSVG